MTPRAARVPAAAVLLALGLGVAGCSGGATTLPAQPSETTVYPVVVVGQAAHILDAVDAGVGAATRAADAAALAVRASGPYLAIAQARFTIDRSRGTAASPAPVVDRAGLVVPTEREWPRFFLAVGSSTGQTTPVLRVLRCPDPRSPYALWAQLSLLPGTTVPDAAPGGEAAAVAPDASDGLLMSPADALAHYADLLTVGAKSRFADQFAPDAFSKQNDERVAADRDQLASVATTQSRHTAVAGSLVAVRTADGGVLVVGELRQDYVITVKPGQAVTVSPDLAALGGHASYTRSVTRTSVEVVALSVPPADSGPVLVVAAEKGDVQVGGS